MAWALASDLGMVPALDSGMVTGSEWVSELGPALVQAKAMVRQESTRTRRKAGTR